MENYETSNGRYVWTAIILVAALIITAIALFNFLSNYRWDYKNTKSYANYSKKLSVEDDFVKTDIIAEGTAPYSVI